MNIKQLAQLVLRTANIREASFVAPSAALYASIEDFSQYYMKSIAVAAAEACEESIDDEASKCIIPITLLLSANLNVTITWAQTVTSGADATYKVHPSISSARPPIKGE